MSLQNVRSARQESPSLSSGLDRGRSAAAVGRYSWGPQDDAASVATMRLALELGINWIDTAAVYGLATRKKLSAGYLDVRRRRDAWALESGARPALPYPAARRVRRWPDHVGTLGRRD
jgi:aryl-alcohol dehydrogenase-like predicted oxidoreductase